MRGIRIDLSEREKVKKQLEERKLELENAFGRTLNVKSPKQLSEFLYKEMRFKKQYHRKTGKLTTNKEALIKLRRTMR